MLARLSSTKPPSEKDLGDAVHTFALPAESPARAREVAVETIAGLHRRALVADQHSRGRASTAKQRVRPQAAPKPGRKLTDEGRRALREAFSLERTPTWLEVRDKHIPALELGLQPGSENARKTLTDAETIAPAALRVHFGLPEAATATALCDALLAELVGLPPGPITIERIRCHVLAQRAGIEAKGDLKQTTHRVVLATLRARGSDKRAMVKALARRWASAATDAHEAQLVQPPPVPPVPVPPVPVPPTPVQVTPAPVQVVSPTPVQVMPIPGQPLSADALLTLVRDAIPTIGADGRFGPEKVFISAIWHRIEGAGGELELSLERFKKWLLTANRDRLLDLARADLVGAMDPQLVAESEIEDLGSTFHFVLDRQVLALGAERRSHAR
ncbi:MAG TPA: hypothetical protein VF469_12810 [Kofleriaceae bacterium]